MKAHDWFRRQVPQQNSVSFWFLFPETSTCLVVIFDNLVVPQAPSIAIQKVFFIIENSLFFWEYFIFFALYTTFLFLLSSEFVNIPYPLQFLKGYKIEAQYFSEILQNTLTTQFFLYLKHLFFFASLKKGDILFHNEF